MISSLSRYPFAKFKKGACVFVPKAFKFSRTMAGQIPTGWDAGRYGIPEDIVAQTDGHWFAWQKL